MSKYRDTDGRTRQTVDELTELRRYFDAHATMKTTVKTEEFCAAYVEANRAEVNLWALKRGIDPIVEAA